LVETHSSSALGLSETSATSTTENVTSHSIETASSLPVTSEATSDLSSQAGSESQTASASPNDSSATASTSNATSTATSEANSTSTDTSSETNITGGEYYLGAYGLWHYRDANGKDLVGPQTVDGIKVYFSKTGVQARGEFAEDRKYYDNEKGALVTNNYVTYQDDTYYVDENGYAIKGPHLINGVHVYFNDDWKIGNIGVMLKNAFGKDNRYYNEKGEQVDFGTNNYFQIGEDWYYAGSDGAIVKGPQTINGKQVYFEKESIWTFQARGEILLTILSSLSQEEARSISENVTWGHRKRFQNGRVMVPYSSLLGYKKGADGNLVIDETQAPTVRLIYRLFLSGLSITEIRKELQHRGILTPRGKTNPCRSGNKSGIPKFR